MIIKNKDFWENEEVIKTQDAIKIASIYERFLFETAKNRLSNARRIDSVNVYGCGTGRDIKIVEEFFAPKQIFASDISENMIVNCERNLSEWRINAKVQTFVQNAVDLIVPNEYFDLVTLLNSMLTYVAIREDRLKIFKNSYESLKNNGVVIGTVHNQVGRPLKTYYFKIKSVFSLVLKHKVGNKDTGFKGFKIPGYYYDKKWLVQDLKESGFNNVEVYSLEEFFVNMGKIYDKSKGYNQLIFIASKNNNEVS
ncbi:class I SAM-dependent methyltransferase [Gelidibacter sp. F2691]|nr:class I SAM-dependent methyltransferase [Gelidibacter sp. F2691]